MTAFYCDTLSNHQQTPNDQIIGKLSNEYSKHHLDQKQQQTRTWDETVKIIKEFFNNIENSISG